MNFTNSVKSVVIMSPSKDTLGVKFLMQKLVNLDQLIAIWFSFVFENDRSIGYASSISHNLSSYTVGLRLVPVLIS